MTDPCNCENYSSVYQSPIELSYNLKDILYSELNFNISETDIISKYNSNEKHWSVLNDIIIYNNDNKYKLIQYHFHLPSEHIINGERYLMELHFVFQSDMNEMKSLFVLSYIIDISENISSNIFYNMILNQPFKLPNLNCYFAYPGSLTTPPFNMNINWRMSNEPLYITLELFNSIKDKCKSARPIQKRNGRDIILVQKIEN